MARRDWEEARRLILFFVGLGGIVWETVAQNVERPALLILFATMVGLPILTWNPPSGGRNGGNGR